MDGLDIKPILESLIFVSESPVRLETLVEVLPEFDKETILEAIRQIKTEHEEGSKGIELVEISGGYQFRTKSKWAEWVQRLKKSKAVKLSRSALETLAIVAYRQPIIRPAIEEIRGVDSGWVLRTLLEKGLIRMMGRKEMPGRPILYGTTKTFLELFSLNALSDLPTPKEVQPPPIPEEISQEETQEVGEQVEVQNGTEGKVEPQLETEAESHTEVTSPVIPEASSLDGVKEQEM
ncbi:MAG: SMC-Scp complex subunit ScpB [Thermodesulfobacteriota bacterium]